ncbi:uncharacterized protein LOC141964275 isoform X3 [Athene noctua]|uniref:uncharacterized protein LOC141964275 isoform X3 n=1 Tax=Athene noctua TaxID=126797 RepID=UPI003EBE7523
MPLLRVDAGHMPPEWGTPCPKGLSSTPVNSASILLLPVSVDFGFWVDAIVSSAKSELGSPLQATAEKVQGLKAATCPGTAELGRPALADMLKILHYYNASFNRDHPHLLEQCKRRGGRKRRAPEAPEVDERHPASSPDGQPAGDTPASPPALTVPTKRRAESPPSLGSARPSPEAAAPTPPEPAGAAGSAGLTPLGIFLLLSTSSQTPGGLQGAAPAPPLIAVPVLGVAAALEKPPQSQSPAVPHCPTCTCSPSPADAGAAVVPQHGTSWSEHRELAAGQ